MAAQCGERATMYELESNDRFLALSELMRDCLSFDAADRPNFKIICRILSEIQM